MISPTRPGRRTLALGAAALAAALGCSIPGLDLAGRECPCAAGWTCQIASRSCVARTTPPDSSAGCIVHSDGLLYCANTGNTPMHAAPSSSSPTVNTLRTTYSWFECWGAGEANGSTTTWYYTEGDVTTARGWLPATAIAAPAAFHADPAAYGLARCGS